MKAWPPAVRTEGDVPHRNPAARRTTTRPFTMKFTTFGGTL